jgi:hypothetical protein
MKIVAVQTAPNGSTSADRGTTCGERIVRGMSYRNRQMRAGKRAAAAATVGSAVHAEKLRKLSPKLAVKTRFVGLDDTSSADARLAVVNCMNTNGWGGTRAWAVK